MCLPYPRRIFIRWAMFVALTSPAFMVPGAALAQAPQVIDAFSIDGIPVHCGGMPTVLIPTIPDVAMNNGAAILINPSVFFRLPTVLKLFWYGHECGHTYVGADEVGADCWSIRAGRDQGWFPPQAFSLLIDMFRNNRGDTTHPPGPARVRAMIRCYSS